MYSISRDRYVYFDESGEILRITNYKEDGEVSCMKVDYSLVEKIMDGSEPSIKFIVIYDISTHEYVIKAKVSTNEFTYNVNDRIHEIGKTDNDVDFTIMHDIKNSCWRFKLNELVRNQLAAQRVSITTPLMFSITKKHDPHVLYRSICVKFSDIIEELDFTVPFVYNEEYETDLSVYTIKKLQSYKYEVLDE